MKIKDLIFPSYVLDRLIWNQKALIITARDMDGKERKLYGKNKIKKKKATEPLPESFKSIKDASDFWDTHSVADYWDISRPAEFEIELEEEPRYIILEPGLARKINQIAHDKKVTSETLVNLWLKEKLSEIQSG